MKSFKISNGFTLFKTKCNVQKSVTKYKRIWNNAKDRKPKIYEAIEAAGSLIIFKYLNYDDNDMNECNEPINDLWLILNICITLYLLFIVIFGNIYNSLSNNVDRFWFSIYNEWILYLNTFNGFLQCWIIYKIWHKYKYPQKHGYLSQHNQFEEDSETEKEINLHSDTDINDDQIDYKYDIHSLPLNNISKELSFLHRLSKMISYISLSGSMLNGIIFWILLHFNLEYQDNAEWIYIILNIQYFVFIPLILMFKFYGSFITFNYLYPIFYIIIYDSLFSIFIIFYEIFSSNSNNITLFARHTVNDNFNFSLLLLISIFMLCHIAIHLFLSFTKNVILIKYLKYILNYTNIKLSQIMDPLDFDIIDSENDDESLNGNKTDNKLGINTEEGSDVEFSSYDFNHNNNKLIDTDDEQKEDEKEKKSASNHIKIVFGSNIHQRYNNMPTLRSLTSQNPDIVLFLGSNIYYDETPRKFGIFKTDSVNDNDEFDHKLNKFFAFWNVNGLNLDLSTEYQRLLKHKDFILCNRDNSLPICLATWDKHDFNKHNKYHSKSAFLSFLDCIDMKHELTEYIDIMKQNTNRGIFYHYDYHHIFESDDNNDNNNQHIFIRFIMLDLKFAKNEQDLFGAQQWLWLRKLLKNSHQRKDKPDWHIFGFGTPCFVEKFDLNESMKQSPSTKEQTGNDKKKQYKLPNLISPIPINGKDFNEWNEMSKQRLLSLIDEMGINDKTLFLSGNMCYSQVLKNKQYNIYEFISSSLTHSISSLIPNDYYVKHKYNNSLQQTNVCNINGYGYLQINKNEWKFCCNDSNGNPHIPLSNHI